MRGELLGVILSLVLRQNRNARGLFLSLRMGWMCNSLPLTGGLFPSILRVKRR